MKRNLIILVLVTLLCSCGDTNESDFLIPKGFTGLVIVIHDQPDGEPAHYHSGTQTYKIPESGILRTQVATKEDWGALPKFYSEKIAPGYEVEAVEITELTSDEAKVYGFGHGTIYKSGSNDPIGYAQFFVSTIDEVDSLANAFEQLRLADLLDEDWTP